MLLRSRPWLAIDTATQTAGLAVVDADRVLAEVVWDAGRRHAGQLAPALQRLLVGQTLKPADLAGIAVAIGPGSYTGLRVGVALAMGLALGAELPVVAVPTLDPLATALVGRKPDGNLWAVVKAGRGRVVAVDYLPGATRAGTAAPVPETFDELLDRAAPGDWVAGELAADERSAARERGLFAFDPPAELRRPSWLAFLGAERESEGVSGPQGLASLRVSYPRGA